MPIYTTTSSNYDNLYTVRGVNTTTGGIIYTNLNVPEHILNGTSSTYTITDSGNENVVFRGQIELNPINTHEKCVDEKDIDVTDSEELDKFLNGFKIKKREKTKNA